MTAMRGFSLFALLILLLFTTSNSTWACPSGQYNSCTFGVCVCLPEIGGTIGQATEHAKKELQAQIGGPAIEAWIVQSRNDAMRGAMPIPPNIRQQLTGYSSVNSMNVVRYKIGDNGIANLGHVTMQLGWGDPEAITLIDVVVFRGPTEASNPALWAHELVHVDQYSSWGVRDFAIRYARSSNDVEAPAYAKGNGYSAWAANNSVFNSGANWQGGGQMPQTQFGAFCYTRAGKFGPGPVQPVGSYCQVQTWQGWFPGQVGP